MKLRWPSNNILRWLNRGLLTFIIVCNGYILAAPLWQQFIFAVQTNITKPVKLQLSNENSLHDVDKSYNHLIIPKLQLDEKIHEGEQDWVIHLGVSHRFHTAKPGQGSNTVLVGHRFTYDGPAVFYHLNKLAPGDDIVVVYDGKIRIYRVVQQKVVPPTASEIEAPTTDERLTIYTCTPLISAKDRLVITAKLQREIP